MHAQIDRWMIGCRFRECLGGFAACGLLRETCSRPSILDGLRRVLEGVGLRRRHPEQGDGVYR
jgi:hypothetical protein